MDGILGGSAVKGSPQGFAINGNVLPVGGCAQTLRPVDKALGELRWVKPRQDATEGVGGGNTVGQIEELLEPIGLGVPILFHVFPALGATDDGAQSNHEDVKQTVTKVRTAWGH